MDKDISKLNIAIVSDHLTKYGGAELTIKVLCEILPQAEIITSVQDKELVKKFFPNNKVRNTFTQYIPFEKYLRDEYKITYPIGFSLFPTDKYDIIITVSNAYGKMIRIPKGAKHIHLCLTQPPYIYMPKRRVMANSKKFTYRVIYQAIFKKPLHAIWRAMDIKSTLKADVVYANSKEVQNRVKKVYKRDDVGVLYPPIELEKLKPNYGKRGDYYLYLGRIECYKGVELAVRACAKLGKKLKIIGKGSDLERITKIIDELGVKENIELMGFVSDQERSDNLSNCIALLSPIKDEDFGVVPVEANACGTPVIAHKSGGALETVIDGKTGVFFKEWDTESLIDAIKRFQKTKIDPKDCVENAKKYSKEAFTNKFLSILNNVLQNS